MGAWLSSHAKREVGEGIAIAPKVDNLGQIQFMKALKKIIDKSDIADIITPTKKPMITVVMLSVCMACMCLCCMTSQRAVQHDIAGR